MIGSALIRSARGAGHAHSTRADGPVGPLRLAGAAEGRAALVRAAGGDPGALAVPEQVHGARVAVAERAASVHAATDALVTATPGVPLFVQGADCPLVALWDESARVGGVVHSGWRGTVARVAGASVAAMCELGASPARLVAAVFPGIGPCCFEVGPEVRAEFEGTFGAASRRWFAPGLRDDRQMCDVRAAVVETLLGCGLVRSRIDVVAGCTACGGVLYSHRASRGAPERHGLCLVVLGEGPGA